MAVIESLVAYNNTGKGANQPFPVGTFHSLMEDPDSSTDVYVEQLSDGRFVNYFGEFSIAGNTITGGQIDGIFLTNSPLNSSGDPGVQIIYGATDGDDLSITEALKPQSDADFYEYLFRFDDTILGSEFKDKINGWAGNDIIWGGPGNDKEWGGPGKDTFYFLKGDGKDKIKDFSKKKDDFLFERGLVKNQKKLEKLAFQKKKKVIIDFGDGDKLTIDDIKLKKFLKSDFSFLEVDF